MTALSELQPLHCGAVGYSSFLEYQMADLFNKINNQYNNKCIATSNYR